MRQSMGAVLAEGRETVVGNNVGYGKEPHMDARRLKHHLQSFARH